MTPIPGDRPGWKRPRHCAHTYTLRSTHTNQAAILSWAKIWTPHWVVQLLSSLAVHKNRPALHGSRYIQVHTWSIIPYWLIADGSLRRYRMGSFHSVPQGELKPPPLMQSLMETLQNTQREITNSEWGYKNTHYVFRMNTGMKEIMLATSTFKFSCSYLLTNQWKLFWSYVVVWDPDVWSKKSPPPSVPV